jgi:hypothetical protein
LKTEKLLSQPVKHLWLGFLLLTIFFSFYSWYSGRILLPLDTYGECLYPRTPNVSTAETAKNLWDKGTLERKEFYALRDYFVKQSSVERTLGFRPDVFSVALDGRLLPKHPWLMSVLAAPFYGLFGQAGFWIFEQLALAGLFWGLYKMVEPYAGARSAAILCSLVAVGTNLLYFYSYDFSYDVLGAALIIGGTALLRTHFFWAGLLLGASLHIRITNGVLIPFIIFAHYPFFHIKKCDWRPWLVTSAGVFLAWGPLLFINHHYFGDALRGPYARGIEMIQGQMVFDSTFLGLSWKYLTSEWQPRLLSILKTNPVFSLAPIGWLLCYRHKSKIYALTIASGGFLHLLVHLNYSYWIGSSGERFVIASILFMLLPLVFIIQRSRESNCETHTGTL